MALGSLKDYQPPFDIPQIRHPAALKQYPGFDDLIFRGFT
jgi:hypothetical protein